MKQKKWAFAPGKLGIGVGVAALAVGLAGCFADHAGRLYGVRDGSQTAITLHDASEHRGVASATLPSGERCLGNYDSVTGDVTYSIEEIDRPKERTQLGKLVLTCGEAHVIQCEFSRYPRGSGYGSCRDNGGLEYRLMF
ncbi:hypothetical protein [Pendulispora albinea]|uniref:Lipoprotein n=1 Tax=Pendulispora albinea TaxID=2741071 RepID=A0ABZ2LWN5_9BACT